MMPLQVGSNLGAVQLGADRARMHVDNLNRGMMAAGRGFEEGLLKSRMLLGENTGVALPLKAMETAGIASGYIPPSKLAEIERQEVMQREQMAAAERVAAAKEAQSLEDANIKGAFQQLTENDNKAQILYGNMNSANSLLLEYERDNASRLSDPMIKATIKAMEERIAEMKAEYNNRKAMSDQMAQTLINSNQGRYGYINDYVNARMGRRNPVEQPPEEIKTVEQPTISDLIEYTPEQSKVNDIVSRYISTNEVTSDTALENMLKKANIPVTQANREYLKERLKGQVADNRSNNDYILSKKGQTQSQDESKREADEKANAAAAATAQAKSLYSSIQEVDTNNHDAMAQWVKGNGEKVRITLGPIRFNFNPATPEEKAQVKADFMALMEKLRVESKAEGNSKGNSDKSHLKKYFNKTK